jgi:hypothetical protein
MSTTRITHFAFIALLALSTTLGQSTAQAAVEVNYTGLNGLSAKAVFELESAMQLSIVLTNNSVSPFGGAGVNGDSNMVLSSINFELGAPLIMGGSVMLNGTSTVVTRNDPPGATPAFWDPVLSGFDLDDEYGYSNTGVGNDSGGGAILVGITAAEIDSLLDSAVTSHSNGGTAVTTFNGGTGLPGGLEFGLVATGSTPFGNSEFIRNGIKILLDLSSPLANLDFLENGTYVEFGSDYSYVGGTFDTPPDPVVVGAVPEATTIAMWLGLSGVFGVGMRMRFRAA